MLDKDDNTELGSVRRMGMPFIEYKLLFTGERECEILYGTAENISLASEFVRKERHSLNTEFFSGTVDSRTNSLSQVTNLLFLSLW